MLLSAGVPVPSAEILSWIERRETMSAERASSESEVLHTGHDAGGPERHHVAGTVAAAPAARIRSARERAMVKFCGIDRVGLGKGRDP